MTIPAAFWPKSWEMPPGFRVLEASASVISREFGGEMLEWVVALVKVPASASPILWVRPLDARFDAGFVAFETQFHQMQPVHASAKVSELRELFDTVWREKRLARHFFLGKNGQLRTAKRRAYEGVLVTLDGIAAWSLGHVSTNVHDATLCHWSQPVSIAEFVGLPALEVWQSLQTLLAEPESDAALARRFALLDHSERHKLAFDYTRLHRESMKPLLEALLLSSEIWEQVPTQSELVFKSWADGRADIYDAEDSGIIHQVNVSEALNAQIQQVWQWSGAINPLAGRFPIAQWMEINSPVIQFLILAPSAHEQLEAKLRWREWKTKHEKF